MISRDAALFDRKAWLLLAAIVAVPAAIGALIGWAWPR